MWNCPVCGEQNEKGMLCGACGFDVSLHYKKYRTLVNVDGCGEAAVGLYRAKYGDTPAVRALIAADPEKFERLIYLIFRAMDGVLEAQLELGKFYRSEFSGENMRARGDFWLGRAAGQAPVESRQKQERLAVAWEKLVEQAVPAEASDAGTKGDAGIPRDREKRRRVVSGTDRKKSDASSADVFKTLGELFGIGGDGALEKPAGRVIKTGYIYGWQESEFPWKDVTVISAGHGRIVGLKRDGSVVTSEYGDMGPDWKDIVAISAGSSHIVGVRRDGTVAAAGENKSGECEVSNWRDIGAVSAGNGYTVGLRENGSVVAVGDDLFGRCNVSAWRGIKAVAAGGCHTVGLREAGTVVAVGYGGCGQCALAGWRDIRAVAAGRYHTVGLRGDGTVIAAGENKYGQCEVSGWSDIIAVSAGFNHTVGLRKDGSVVAAGSDQDGQCRISGWRDITAISAGGLFTAAIQKT